LAFCHGDEYIPSPVGWVLARCDHTVENGATLSKVHDGILVTNPNGTKWTIPRCDAGTQPVFKRHEAPPNAYDGWTVYTAFNTSSSGFDSFIGNMNVADEPASTPEVLYIFTGLQNIDWVPVVDSVPTTPFDIIQPVIQFPGDAGRYWSVKSWYVTLDIGTIHSRELRLSVGDTVFGNMTKTGSTAWFIGSTSVQSGETVSINVDHDRLSSQPWAYNTIECYSCNGCNTYPKQPELFTDLKLTQDGKSVTASWQVNPKPSKNTQCKENAVVNSP